MTTGTVTPCITVIINACSGSVENEELATEVRAKFTALGARAEVLVAGAGDDIRRMAVRAIRDGCSTVVAGGGDGTVSTVASAVVGTGAALGVLPLGTLNHFAKDAGIPLDTDGAIAAIVDGEVVSLDTGEVNGHIFINNSSIGIYPMIVGHREAEQRRGNSKWWAFFKALLTAFRRFPFMDVRIASDADDLPRKTAFVFVGNNEYELNGLDIGTRDRMDSGRLFVYAAHRTGRFGLVGIALRGLLGLLREAGDLDTFRTQGFEIHLARRRVRVALDGEVITLTPPLRYRCRPRELRVVVPKRSGNSA